MASEYEDKYYALREEMGSLKKTKNEQESLIKRMYTKMAMIEENIKRKTTNSDNGTGASATVSRGPRNIEMEKFVHSLKRENVELRRRNQELMDTNRKLQTQLKLPSTARRLQASKHPKSSTPRSTTIENKKRHDLSLQARDTFHHKESDDLVSVLRSRLMTAEKQIQKMSFENDELHALQMQLHRKNSTTHFYNSNSNNSPEQSENLQNIQETLRDRSAQLGVLSNRYDHLEAKASAEREIQERTLEQMEHFNKTIRELKKQLQNVHMERDMLTSRVAVLNVMEEEAETLREQNKRLEERMTSLCESPFIASAFHKKERVDKLAHLEKQDVCQKLAIETLHANATTQQETIHGLQERIHELQAQTLQMQQEQEQNAIDLQTHASPIASLSSPAKAQSAKAQAPHVINTTTTTAIARVVRDSSKETTHNNPSHVSFLEQPEGELESLPQLRNKCHSLQVLYLETVKDLERAEKMLQAQVNINRDLSLELEEVLSSKRTGQGALECKLEDLQVLAGDRLRKITLLEATLKQMRYTKRMPMNENGELGVNSVQGSKDDNVVTFVDEASWLQEALTEISSGENLMELWIVKGSFAEEYVSSSTCTFVMCDFFNFESQSTPLLVGSSPGYNLSATYKVSLDDIFLRYMAADTLTLEIHQAFKGDFQLLGLCTIPLHQWLTSSSGKMQYNAQSVICPSTGTVLGSLFLKMRSAVALPDLWTHHLRNYPTDVQLIPSSKPNVTKKETLSSTTNTLCVQIFKCMDLEGQDPGILPSPYVHFQLLGFADAFSSIIPSSSCPEFNETWSYPVSVEPTLLRVLNDYKLSVTVFDDTITGSSENDASFLGVATIATSELLSGDPVVGRYPLLNSTGDKVGKVHVKISWQNPESVVTSCNSSSLHVLSQVELEDLLHRLVDPASGAISYRLFLALSCPASSFRPLWEELRQAVRHFVVAEELDSTTLLFRLFSTTDLCQHISLEEIKTALTIPLRLQKWEKENEWKELGKTLCCMNDGYIVLFDLMAFIGPLSVAHVMVERKCQETMAKYISTKQNKKTTTMNNSELFEKYDSLHTGRIGRVDFRKALQGMGFEFQPTVGTSTGTDNRSFPSSSAMPTLDSEEQLLESSKRPVTEYETRKQLFMERMKAASRDKLEAERETSKVAQTTVNFTATHAQHHQAARAVQRTFRAYSNQNAGVVQEEKGCTLVHVERILQDYFAVATQETLRKTMLLRHCSGLDTSSSGLLHKRQLVHVFKGLQPPLILSAAQWQTLFHSFCESQNGGRFPYKTLLQFLNYTSTSMQPPPIVVLLRSKLGLEKSQALRLFTKEDSQHTGFVSYSVFVHILSSGLSLSELSGAHMNDLLGLFDVTGTDVAYGPFVHYVSQQPASQTLTRLKTRLLLHRTALQTWSGGRSSRSWLDFGQAFSTWSGGSILSDLELNILQSRFSTNENSSVEKTKNPTTRGVSIDLLLTWLEEVNHDGNVVHGSELSLQSIQQLCWNSLSLLQHSSSHNIWSELYTRMEHYDTMGEAVISSFCFETVLKQFGVVLSHDLVEKVSASFSRGSSEVQYKAFLQWSTPVVLTWRSVQERLSSLSLEVSTANQNTTWSRKQVLHSLKEWQVKLSGTEERMLLNHVDPHRSDRISAASVIALLTLKNTSKKSKKNTPVTWLDLQEYFELCVEEGIDYRSVFEKVDVSCSGHIDTVETLRTLFTRLNKALHGRGPTTTTLSSWLDTLPTLIPITTVGLNYTSLLNHARKLSGPEHVWTAEERLRRYCRKNGSYFTAAFSLSEYWDFIKRSDVALQYKDAEMLFARLHLNRKAGSVVSLAEWNVFLTDAFYRDVQNKAVLKLKRKKLVVAFTSRDPRNTLQISSDAFYEILHNTSVLSPSDIARLTKRYELQPGKIAYKLVLLLWKDKTDEKKGGEDDNYEKNEEKEEEHEQDPIFRLLRKSPTWLDKCFQLCDSHDGKMAYDTFVHGCQKAGVVLTRTEGSQLQTFMCSTSTASSSSSPYIAYQELALAVLKPTVFLSRCLRLVLTLHGAENIWTAMAHFDLDGRGIVGAEDVRLSLRKLNIHMSVVQIQKTWTNTRQLSSSSTVRYADWLKRLCPVLEDSKSSLIEQRNNTPRLSPSPREVNVLQEIKRTDASALLRACRHFDEDGSESLSLEEFQLACRKVHLRFSLRMLTDTFHSRRVQYCKLLNEIIPRHTRSPSPRRQHRQRHHHSPPSSPSPLHSHGRTSLSNSSEAGSEGRDNSAENKAMERLTYVLQMASQGKHLWSLFEQADVDRRGYLTPDILTSTLLSLGYKLPKKHLPFLLERYGVHNNTYLDYRALLENVFQNEKKSPKRSSSTRKGWQTFIEVMHEYGISHREVLKKVTPYMEKGREMLTRDELSTLWKKNWNIILSETTLNALGHLCGGSTKRIVLSELLDRFSK